MWRGLGIMLAVGLLASSPARAACAGADTAVTAKTLGQARVALRCLIDAERSAAGLKAYAKSPKLTRLARRWVRRMRDEDFFSHTSPEGQTREQRFRAAGYKHDSGENLGFGWTTPRAVMDVWMNSRIHRSNILSRRWGFVGVGIAVGGSRKVLYTVTFGPARS